ncbi:MAG: D-glycero-beta-D-manno-heptose-7-phosphate kinase [Candidatus Sumerlaeia bacterium]
MPLPPFPELLSRISRMKIVVAGDIILDRYIRGEVSRVSPEAPVPVVRVVDENFVAGGAANVAANLAAAGARVQLFGLTGRDAGRDTLLALLAERGIRTRGVLDDPRRPTITKTRVIAGQQQMLRLDREQTLEPDGRLARRIVAALGKAIPTCSGVIVSDYAKGFLAPPVLSALLALARRHSKPVFVDPKGGDFGRYAGATTLTPNQREAEEAAGVPIGDDPASLREAARRLLKQTGCGFLTITLGARGSAVYERPGRLTLVPAFRREVFDITGAGDTFISHYLLGFLAGAAPAEAARMANFAASITVGRLGVATVSPEDLAPFFSGEAPVKKLKTPEQLAALLNDLRAQRKKIVFTNGVFDLLHVGHIKFLERARELGDFLIVAINSDRSARLLKAPPRPILGEVERAQILGALACVDCVTIFDDTSALPLIQAVRPDVLVKGKNLRMEEVVGQDFVMRYGGEVHLLPFFGNQTTSDLLSDLTRRKP